MRHSNGMDRAVLVAITLLVLALTLTGCMSIRAAIPLPQVDDESLTLGMERTDVESVLRAFSYETEFVGGQLIEYRYEDSNAWPYRAAIYFPFGPADLIFAPIEYWIHRSAQRWASGLYDIDGRLVYFVVKNASGNLVMQLGGSYDSLAPKARSHTVWDAIRGPVYNPKGNDDEDDF